MKIKVIILFIMSYFFIFSSQSHARKPAVEPVMSFPIDQYKNVPPHKAKSFDFSNKTRDAASTVNKQEPKVVTKAGSQNALPTFLIIGFLLLLPIGFLVAIKFDLQKNEKEIVLMDSHMDNVFHLPLNRDSKTEDSKETNEKDHHKKAS